VRVSILKRDANCQSPQLIPLPFTKQRGGTRSGKHRAEIARLHALVELLVVAVLFRARHFEQAFRGHVACGCLPCVSGGEQGGSTGVTLRRLCRFC